MGMRSDFPDRQDKQHNTRQQNKRSGHRLYRRSRAYNGRAYRRLDDVIGDEHQDNRGGRVHHCQRYPGDNAGNWAGILRQEIGNEQYFAVSRQDRMDHPVNERQGHDQPEHPGRLTPLYGAQGRGQVARQTALRVSEPYADSGSRGRKLRGGIQNKTASGRSGRRIRCSLFARRSRLFLPPQQHAERNNVKHLSPPFCLRLTHRPQHIGKTHRDTTAGGPRNRLRGFGPAWFTANRQWTRGTFDIPRNRADNPRMSSRSSVTRGLQKELTFRKALVSLTNELLASQLDEYFYQTALERTVELVPAADGGSVLTRYDEAILLPGSAAL